MKSNREVNTRDKNDPKSLRKAIDELESEIAQLIDQQAESPVERKQANKLQACLEKYTAQLNKHLKTTPNTKTRLERTKDLFDLFDSEKARLEAELEGIRGDAERLIEENEERRRREEAALRELQKRYHSFNLQCDFGDFRKAFEINFKELLEIFKSNIRPLIRSKEEATKRGGEIQSRIEELKLQGQKYKKQIQKQQNLSREIDERSADFEHRKRMLSEFRNSFKSHQKQFEAKAALQFSKFNEFLNRDFKIKGGDELEAVISARIRSTTEISYEPRNDFHIDPETSSDVSEYIGVRRQVLEIVGDIDQLEFFRLSPDRLLEIYKLKKKQLEDTKTRVNTELHQLGVQLDAARKKFEMLRRGKAPQ